MFFNYLINIIIKKVIKNIKINFKIPNFIVIVIPYLGSKSRPEIEPIKITNKKIDFNNLSWKIINHYYYLSHPISFVKIIQTIILCSNCIIWIGYFSAVKTSRTWVFISRRTILIILFIDIFWKYCIWFSYAHSLCNTFFQFLIY